MRAARGFRVAGRGGKRRRPWEEGRPPVVSEKFSVLGKPAQRSFRKESRALARHAGSVRYCASKEGGEGARRGGRRRSAGPCGGGKAAARSSARVSGSSTVGVRPARAKKLACDVGTGSGNVRGRAPAGDVANPRGLPGLRGTKASTGAWAAVAHRASNPTDMAHHGSRRPGQW
jgi:hypothetical protein